MAPWVAQGNPEGYRIMNGPFNVEKAHYLLVRTCPVGKSWTGEEKQTPEPFHIMNEQCAKGPSTMLGECETRKLVANCEQVVREGVEEFCKKYNTSPACAWLPTTTLPPITDNPSESTTSTSNNLPLIIGAVVGVVLIIAIAIGLFCYCRKKKMSKKGGQGSGTTTGGTTGGTTQQSGMTSTTRTKSKNSTMV
ncbi:hypothetical protein GCK72_003378 [Caenorhabditis remanei]|uniref:Uncharacterized protein n=1 Tax=Caenorhabditis remanei TaxID=31234 RepID=A0A6A5HWB0_CAERE|nr:hypothetical protein GCK72_003378 [Caenorhabditis remanei]KAF1771551.1 hypothetical protein GCK72_003378 [Caenorhabditis remanei]